MGKAVSTENVLETKIYGTTANRRVKRSRRHQKKDTPKVDVITAQKKIEEPITTTTITPEDVMKKGKRDPLTGLFQDGSSLPKEAISVEKYLTGFDRSYLLFQFIHATKVGTETKNDQEQFIQI